MELSAILGYYMMNGYTETSWMKFFLGSGQFPNA